MVCKWKSYFGIFSFNLERVKKNFKYDKKISQATNSFAKTHKLPLIKWPESSSIPDASQTSVEDFGGFWKDCQPKLSSCFDRISLVLMDVHIVLITWFSISSVDDLVMRPGSST